MRSQSYEHVDHSGQHRPGTAPGERDGRHRVHLDEATRGAWVVLPGESRLSFQRLEL